MKTSLMMREKISGLSFNEFFPPQGLLVDEGGQMEEAEQEEVKKIRIVQIERKATRSGEQSNSADGFELKEVIF